MKDHYIAGNRYEGCGHRHGTAVAAQRCLRRIDTTHGKPRVYHIITRTVAGCIGRTAVAVSVQRRRRP